MPADRPALAYQKRFYICIYTWLETGWIMYVYVYVYTYIYNFHLKS